MTNIWYNNPGILIDKPTDIFPINFNTLETKEEKINSITRLAILVLLGSVVFGMKAFLRILVVITIIILLTIIYYERNKVESFNLRTDDKLTANIAQNIQYRTNVEDPLDRTYKFHKIIEEQNNVRLMHMKGRMKNIHSPYFGTYIHKNYPIND